MKEQNACSNENLRRNNLTFIMVSRKTLAMNKLSSNEIENYIEAWYVTDSELNTGMSLIVYNKYFIEGVI